MSDLAQLSHLLLDVDFFDKPKIKALAFEHGQIAVFLVVKLMAALSRATSATIDMSAALQIADETKIGLDEAKKIISYCFDKSILQGNETLLTSNRVVEDQSKLAKKREQTSERQKRFQERTKNAPETCHSPVINALITQKESVSDASGKALSTRFPVTDTDPVTVIECNSEIEITKNRRVGENGSNLNPSLPEKQNSSPAVKKSFVSRGPSMASSKKIQPEPTSGEMAIDDYGPPNDADEALKTAYSKLQTAAGQDWTNKTLFMNTGRRPLKDYPEIFLTPEELADVIRDYELSGIPHTKYKKAFLNVQSKLLTMRSGGQSTDRVSVFSWLIGFVKQDLMEETTKEVRMQKATGARI